VRTIALDSLHNKCILVPLNPKTFNITGVVAVADPYNGCSKILNIEEVEGKIVLVAPSMYMFGASD
jgi:hypothetical protein